MKTDSGEFDDVAPCGDATPRECDCASSLERKLTAMFKEKVPTATSHEVKLQGYGFGVIGNTMVLRPFMPYKASADYPLKKGGTKWRTQTGNMVFSYCPFCGVKFASSTVSGAQKQDQQ